MSNKVRVYEVARDLGMDSGALVSMLKSLGVSDVRNHMSAVAPEAVERVKRHLNKQNGEKVVEERIRPTVVKRRSKRRVVPPAGSEPAASSSPVASRAPARAAAAPTRAEPVRREARAEPVRRAPAKSEPAAKAPSSKPAVAPAPSTPAAPAAAPAAQAPAAQAKPAAAEPAAAKPAAKTPEAPPAAAEKAPPAEAKPAAAAEGPKTPPAKPAEAVEEAPQKATAPTAEKAPAKAPEAKPKAAPSPAEPKPAPAAAQPAAAAKPAAAQPAPAKAPARPPATVQPRPAARPSAPPPRPSSPPKTGIDVWEGRPGVPMPQPPRGPTPRRVQYDAKAGGGPGRRPMGPGGRHRMKRFGGAGKRGTGQILTQERSERKKVVKIQDTITLQQLSNTMALKAGQVLRKLMQLGMSGVHINSTIDYDTAKILANEFGWEVENVAVSEEAALQAARGLSEEKAPEDDKDVVPRPPVVTVMGHVDHGKTSLLDRIRKANVVQGEAGGITQHIGAYSVDTPKGKITFLDTPGHAAFSAMRARGAQATDIVVLIVAADDGVMPQTREAISHAKDAEVPIIVAVNKIDKEDAQPERVRRELSEVGLVPEEWGGDTLFTEVSAHTGEGIDELLEQIALQAEVLELRANPKLPAEGLVIEAKLDRGMGAVATVLVTNGTLKRGEHILAGRAFGKLRAMQDHRGKKANSAGPSIPVAVIGLDDVPGAGDPVHAVKDAKKAQEIAQERKNKLKSADAIKRSGKKLSMEDILSKLGQSQTLELKLIIKADVQGSVEALNHALNELSTEKVKVSIVHSGAGGITESDVNLAAAAGGIIIGFNVKPAGKAASLAQQEGIEIRPYSVIYAVVDDVKLAMEGLLAPKLVEEEIGQAEVLQTFKISKAGTVAGCMVQQGVIRRGAGVRIKRGKDIIFEGDIGSLKRFKDDVKEVKSGFECGITIDGFNDIDVGDIFVVHEMKQVKQTLD